jgi:hypothetical protein
MQQLSEAKRKNLIVEFAAYNTCEINSYIIVTFKADTNNKTKHKLVKHIKQNYDDVIATHFSTTNERLYIEYDDWEILPKYIAF